MDELQDFAAKEMIEQIVILDEIRDKRMVAAIPVLMNEYATGQHDQAVDEMLYHALYEIMEGQDGAIVAGLRHPSPRVQLLAIRRVNAGCGDGVQEQLLANLQAASDPAVIAEIIRALQYHIDARLVDIFIAYLGYEDIEVVAGALHSLLASAPARAHAYLLDEVRNEGLALTVNEPCGLRLAILIDNLAAMKTKEGLEVIMTFIHHPNPAFRRLTLTALLHFGAAALPSLANCLATGDRDERIMAANMIGLLGEKKGADILLNQLDMAKEMEANLRFAVYEGLGRIPSIKSVIALTDGLADPDELVLMAVIIGLNDQCNPGVVKTIIETIDRHDERAQRVVQTIVSAKALQLFKALYASDSHRPMIVDALAASRNSEAVAVFKEELATMTSPQAAADLVRLAAVTRAAATRKVVAADDSKAMLSFYNNAAAELGIDLVTAKDGLEALEIMRAADSVDLLVTDLNMPNMTGIELAREIRKMAKWSQIPILMATTESEKSQNDAAREAGVTSFISKPFTKDLFQNTLQELFSSLVVTP